MELEFTSRRLKANVVIYPNSAKSIYFHEFWRPESVSCFHAQTRLGCEADLDVVQRNEKAKSEDFSADGLSCNVADVLDINASFFFPRAGFI